MAVFNKDKTMSSKGRTTYDLSILSNIVTLSVSEVDGVAPDVVTKDQKSESYLKRIKLDIDGDKVYCDLSLYVKDGTIVPEVAFKVQEAVKTAIETMTKFKISAVDVRILGVVFEKEQEVVLNFAEKIENEEKNA